MMKKLILFISILALFAVQSFGQVQQLNTAQQTVIGDATEYITIFTSGQYQSVAYDVEVTALGDSIAGDVELQAALDDNWFTLDADSYANGNSVTTGTVSTGTLTLADGATWFIEYINPSARKYRFKIAGTAANDFSDGTQVTVKYYLK